MSESLSCMRMVVVVVRHVLAALRKDIKLKKAKYNMCQVGR